MDIEALQQLYSEQEQKKVKGLPVEEVLAMQALAERLAEINLDKVIKRKLNKRPVLERAVEKKLIGAINRKKVKKKPGRPKVHWKTKEKRRKAYRIEIANPRRWKKEAEQWKTGEGWYAYCSKLWRQNKIGIELTEAEWLEHVYPKVEGTLFTVQRYNKKGPISLDNILCMYEGKVLFDGKEFTLEKIGACLTA